MKVEEMDTLQLLDKINRDLQASNVVLQEIIDSLEAAGEVLRQANQEWRDEL